MHLALKVHPLALARHVLRNRKRLRNRARLRNRTRAFFHRFGGGFGIVGIGAPVLSAEPRVRDHVEQHRRRHLLRALGPVPVGHDLVLVEPKLRQRVSDHLARPTLKRLQFRAPLQVRREPLAEQARAADVRPVVVRPLLVSRVAPRRAVLQEDELAVRVLDVVRAQMREQVGAAD